MTSEQFCYWLQGFSEVSKTDPTHAQWVEIKNHLYTVFHKTTPSFRDGLQDISKLKITC